MSKITVSIVVILLTASRIPAALAATAPPVVQTANGPLQGKDADGIREFYGVRYAQPPVGNLRWRPPQPLLPWKETQSAARFGPACSQRAAPDKAVGRIAPEQSEDCLFLNIWAPGRLPAQSRAPVVVYIFGGGFTTGDASGPGSNLEALARRGIIALSLNYRLGYLGWFAYPELTREAGLEGTGNFGLMDQIASLQWIHDNISAFGGDAGNVTVVGSSSGGISVNALMASPLARGLFAKAITSSGFGREPSQSLAAAERAGVAFARNHGAENLVQLRQLTIAQIMAVPPTPAGDPLSPDPTGLIKDVASLPTDILPAFMQGEEAPVPWLVGSNSFDGSNLYKGLRGDNAKIIDSFDASVKPQLMSVFNPDGVYHADRVAGAILTARVLNEPARYLARAHAKRGVPTYLYYLNYVVTAKRRTEWGAVHGSEKAFMFDNFDALPGLPDYNLSPSDKSIADAMIAYLVNFAKTGDPNGPGLPAWPSERMGTSLVIDSSGEHAETDFLKPRLDLMEEQAGHHLRP